MRVGILPEDLLKHLVIYEPTHLRVRKHNNKFWRIVGKYSKDYKEKEKELIGYWFLSYKNEVWNRMIINLSY